MREKPYKITILPFFFSLLILLPTHTSNKLHQRACPPPSRGCGPTRSCCLHMQRRPRRRVRYLVTGQLHHLNKHQNSTSMNTRDTSMFDDMTIVTASKSSSMGRGVRPLQHSNEHVDELFVPLDEARTMHYSKSSSKQMILRALLYAASASSHDTTTTAAARISITPGMVVELVQRIKVTSRAHGPAKAGGKLGDARGVGAGLGVGMRPVTAACRATTPLTTPTACPPWSSR